MIRRDGSNGTWLVISQVDHAHVSGEIAAVWGNAEVSPLPNKDELVAAVRDHDDGWRDWERLPTIDPDSGWPRNFTEMPMDVATGIWRQSILVCRTHSPLGGIWVGRHFTFLGEKAREGREEGSQDALAIDAFLREQHELESKWRGEVEGVDPAQMDASIEAGFRWVQFFDAMSLWLCCAERTEPQQTPTPQGNSLSMTPGTDHSRITLEPWPLSVERLELSVPAWRIPARRFGSDTELQAAIKSAGNETLNWTLEQTD